MDPRSDKGGRATARTVLDALRIQHRALAFATDGARLAINQRFAQPDSEVREGDEVALISLVGGG